MGFDFLLFPLGRRPKDSRALETRNVPRSMLPMGAKEGDVLTVGGGGEWRIEEGETAARAARVRARLERLRKRG